MLQFLEAESEKGRLMCTGIYAMLDCSLTSKDKHISLLTAIFIQCLNILTYDSICFILNLPIFFGGIVFYLLWSMIFF